MEGKARELCSKGKGKRPHCAQSLNAEEEEISWKCGQLGTFTPESLRNTVFWLLIQHFGSRGRQQHDDIKINDIVYQLRPEFWVIVLSQGDQKKPFPHETSSIGEYKNV